MRSVNRLLAEANDIGNAVKDTSDDDWDGFESSDETKLTQAGNVVDHEEEYMDDDRYTTVTVEAVEVDKQGLKRIADEEDEEDESVAQVTKDVENNDKDASKSKKTWPKKIKKKKFRYETKAERKADRAKDKAKRRSKAEARKGND